MTMSLLAFWILIRSPGSKNTISAVIENFFMRFWVKVLSKKSNIRACPALVPVPSFDLAPTINRFPSLVRETDQPNSSAVASASKSMPR